MQLDWTCRLQLADQNVLAHYQSHSGRPRVTVGVPTFNRGEMITRMLQSLANQSYRDFVLIVSDNSGDDPKTQAALDTFKERIPEIYLIGQPENLGAIRNMNFLLACAETEYFMWLADDDEVSETYLSELVAILDQDPKTVSAMGGWVLKTGPDKSQRKQQPQYAAASRAARIFKFIAGPSNDTFYYGLHRTEMLRRCTFGDYLWPNRGVLTNWCYVFLFDMIWQGQMRVTNKADWICHLYSEKQYSKAFARDLTDRLRTLARRANVYALYCAKTARRGAHLLPVALGASLYGFGREVISAPVRILLRRLRRTSL